MQSGSDAVLRRMRRRWQSGRFVARCESIREVLDRPALTTDVIVGFPGETDADFDATCRAVEQLRFSKVHIFRFSPRQGTPAAEMPDQIPPQLSKDRAARLAEIAEGQRQQFLESLSGETLQVLVESAVPDRPGILTGTSARYAPIELTGGIDQVGQLVEVTAGLVGNGHLWADKPCKPGSA